MFLISSRFSDDLKKSFDINLSSHQDEKKMNSMKKVFSENAKHQNVILKRIFLSEKSTLADKLFSFFFP